ncbi:hypothetical protein [Luteipulveratus mongoliensis]|uniref:PknH-like extracellular domain-containing protein n=1 Tax=Luteipulveratus mongoliensis TaxID=571913 RepID=A0A0K1JMM7_9MICO|nr:hypothetical protein [Luteipulveratus mongoliensis]AKU17833.1 hypothetical protein VV02_21510 [Luteipulveratus mongoliensis]
MTSKLIRRSVATTAIAVLAMSGAGVAAAEASPAPAAGAAATVQRAITTIPDVAPSQMAGWPIAWDLGQTPNIAPIMRAQRCDPVNPDGLAPTAGRNWAYFDASDGDNLTKMSADLTVTGWANGRQALRAMRTDGGRCTLMPGWHEVPWAGTSKSTHLMLKNGKQYAAVVVKGNYLVSASIWAGHHTAAESRAVAITGAAETVANL